MAAPGLDRSLLTRSVRTALEVAGARAALRARPGSRKTAPLEGSPGEVIVPDLLVGIFAAHPNESEPAALLQYSGTPAARLLDLLEPSGFVPPDLPTVPSEGGALPELDDESRSALATAVDLSRRYNPESEGLVRLRDLFGGILLGTSSGPTLLGRAVGDRLRLDDVVATYPDFLALDSGSSDFREFLGERIGRPAADGSPNDRADAAPAGPPGGERRIAIVDADGTGTEDWVGIGAEVDAFAYLIAAPALRPPLAIGLFGDWGAGKSFFMEALRRRVDRLTASARASDAPQADLAVYRHIAQIEFNAWHYVEGNLWASLVEHIFQSLGGSGDRADATAIDERMRRWTNELESQRVARARVEAKLRTLRAEQDDRARALELTRAERRERLQSLKESRARDVLEAVVLDPETRAAVGRLLDDLGLLRAETSAATARDALGDARAVLQAGNPLLTPLRRSGRAGVAWALALICVAIAGPLVAWATSAVPGVTIDAVTRTFSGVAAFLASAAVVVRRGSGWLAESLKRVEAADSRIEELRAERAKELAREEAEIEHRIGVLDEEVGRLATEKAEIDQRIAGIEEDLRTLSPTRLLSEFIDERVGSEDYRKHLGVPALVRRDFQRLSTLIQEQNRALLAGEAVPSETTPLVNRVVLYIDDLDRCPPDRVVEVLQAVHLLLAFELFVVVVAVDSRWLSRSLLSHYDTLLGATDGATTTAHATPDNYLEKIFQVPFHVRPLTEDAQQRILLGLLGVPGETATAGGTTPSGAAGGAGRGDASRPDRAETNVVEVGRISDVRIGDREDDRERSAAGVPAPVSVAGVGTRPPDLSASRMRIRPGELEFMATLKPLLGRTPRAMKRFVNVYRLLTAIAESREPRFYADGNRAEGDPPPYRIAMFLLAVVTGLPGMAPEFLQAVSQGLAVIRSGKRKREDVTVAWILQRFSAGGLVLRPEGPSPEYRRLKQWLERVEGGRWNSLPLDSVAPWVDAVSRFSFRADIGVEA